MLEGRFVEMNHFYHYVISAKSVTKRRQAQIERFAKWGMLLLFFDAIKGNQLSEEELDKLSATEGLLT